MSKLKLGTKVYTVIQKGGAIYNRFCGSFDIEEKSIVNIRKTTGRGYSSTEYITGSHFYSDESGDSEWDDTVEIGVNAWLTKEEAKEAASQKAKQLYGEHRSYHKKCTEDPCRFTKRCFVDKRSHREAPYDPKTGEYYDYDLDEIKKLRP